MNDTVAVVLSAGLGTRMKSNLAKGLHRLAGRSMVAYPIASAEASGITKVVVVVGHQREAVERAVRSEFKDLDLSFAVQEDQKGTAHATNCARAAVGSAKRVLLLNGDLPLITSSSIIELEKAYSVAGGGFALATAKVPNPGGFGRIVRDDHGHIAAIVERKDATPEQLEIDEVNVGLYLAQTDLLFNFLDRIGSANAGSEFYLTDIVKLVRANNQLVGDFRMPSASDARQVNDRIELSEAEGALFMRKARELMTAGVTIHQPETVQIEWNCQIGRDTEIGANVEIKANSKVGSVCTIGHGSILTNTVVGDGVEVKPYCVFTDSVIGNRSVLGPYSHLRPGSELKEGAHVGNFVEMKKAVLGVGSKANHLTYLGDSTIGDGVNIGAGTITCNYDGVNKHRTEIGDGAFIGSDTQLVAPVKVGTNAYIGAGTTVTQDVPDGALAISRVRQKHIEGYADRKKAT